MPSFNSRSARKNSIDDVVSTLVKAAGASNASESGLTTSFKRSSAFFAFRRLFESASGSRFLIRASASAGSTGAASAGRFCVSIGFALMIGVASRTEHPPISEVAAIRARHLRVWFFKCFILAFLISGS